MRRQLEPSIIRYSIPNTCQQFRQMPIQGTPNWGHFPKCCRLQLNFVMGSILVTRFSRFSRFVSRFIYLVNAALVAEDVASNYLQLTNNYINDIVFEATRE